MTERDEGGGGPRFGPRTLPSGSFLAFVALWALWALWALLALWSPGTAQADLFSPPVSYPAGASPRSVAVGDFNGDSRPDLAVANYGSNDVSVLLGGGAGSFAPAPGSPVPAGTGPFSLAVGDFNGDSRPDLAVANFNSRDVSILLGTGDGGFTAAFRSKLAVGSLPIAVVSADFNDDSDPDLAVANAGSDDVSIMLGGPGASFVPAGTPLSVGDFPGAVAVGDFNGDSDPDLAVVNSDANDVSILLGGVGPSFTSAAGSPHAVGNLPVSVAVGDFNGDPDPDLAVVNFGSSSISVLLGGAGADFSPAPGAPFPAPTGAFSIVAADFGGDSRTDLALTSSGAVSILLGGTGGSFTAAPQIFFPSANPVALAVGDFNADERPDLAVAGYVSDSVWILLAANPEPPSATARCTITGTNKNDVISGTPGDDVICAGNGDDRIFGLGGRDVLIGGNGKDTLAGGPGADLLVGGNGKDTLDARDSAPDDVADGGHGSDACRSDVGDFVAGCP